MSQQSCITVHELAAQLARRAPPSKPSIPLTLVDVRKHHAIRASGRSIAGARYRSPFGADDWWPEFADRKVVVFCVHGHEVSQAVSGFLRDQGVDCAYLEGGFEAWVEAGGDTEPMGMPE